MTFRDRLAIVNRRVTNPVVRTFAGRLPLLAIVTHRGRKSGRRYRTPVVAVRRDGGYLIALIYGADRDWVRNVLAADGCTLEQSGRTIELGDPKLLGERDGMPLIPAPVRPVLRLLRVTEFLRLSTTTRPG